MRKTYPIDFVPNNSCLTFIKQTIKDGIVNGKRISEKALYQCKCGAICEGLTNNVKRGRKLSCGCRLKEVKGNFKHGFSNHPLYTVWENMISRCGNPKTESYSRYGGDGVIVCEEWLHSPESFIKWGLSNGWKKGLQLDKDIKGDGKIYSPETCMFVTAKKNSNNRKDNRHITFNGVTKNLSQWADELGITHGGLHYRLKKWDLNKALSKTV